MVTTKEKLMYCPICGAKLIEKADFCYKCGRNVKEIVNEAQKAETAAAGPEKEVHAADENKNPPPVNDNSYQQEMTSSQGSGEIYHTYQNFVDERQKQQYRQPDGYEYVPQGNYPAYNRPAANDDKKTLITVIKVFLIIACIVNGLFGFLIPLAWCIPMTVHCFRKLNAGEPISMVMKICILIFVSIVSGVCMLCLDEDL